MTRDAVSCLLPGGFLDADGACHRDAIMKALSGREEMALHALAPDASVATAVTMILSLAVRTIGPYRTTPAMASALLPADRDYLLRRLWGVTFGGRIALVLTCPFCSTEMDADIDIDSIPVRARPQQRSYSVCAAGLEMVFRLPQAADVDVVAGRAFEGRDRANALLARCLLSVGDRVDVTEDFVGDMPLECRSALEQSIEDACPDAVVEIGASCAECGRPFETSCDLAARFLAELHCTRAELRRNIHVLSLYHHWPLREILSLSTRARRQYVRLLVSELGSGHRAEAGRV